MNRDPRFPGRADPSRRDSHGVHVRPRRLPPLSGLTAVADFLIVCLRIEHMCGSWGRTLRRERAELLAFLQHRITSGYTEGIHTKIKLRLPQPPRVCAQNAPGPCPPGACAWSRRAPRPPSGSWSRSLRAFWRTVHVALMRWILFLLVPLAASECTVVQEPLPQAVLSTAPLVYVPEARVETRETTARGEVVHFRTYRSRTMGELHDDILAGLKASRIQLICSEVMALPGHEPYLRLRVPAGQGRDVGLHIVPLDGHWLWGHSRFRASITQLVSGYAFLRCPVD